MSAKHYRRNPFVVEAILYTGENIHEIEQFAHGTKTRVERPTDGKNIATLITDFKSGTRQQSAYPKNYLIKYPWQQNISVMRDRDFEEQFTLTEV